MLGHVTQDNFPNYMQWDKGFESKFVKSFNSKNLYWLALFSLFFLSDRFSQKMLYPRFGCVSSHNNRTLLHLRLCQPKRGATAFILYARRRKRQENYYSYCNFDSFLNPLSILCLVLNLCQRRTLSLRHVPSDNQVKMMLLLSQECPSAHRQESFSHAHRGYLWEFTVICCKLNPAFSLKLFYIKEHFVTHIAYQMAMHSYAYHHYVVLSPDIS